KSAATATNPANLSVDIRYDGEQTAPYQIGSYEVTAIITDDHYEGAASGTLVILDTRTPLENWRFENFETYENSGDAANSADPDHDGILNLMEFALALDPELPSILPATLVIAGNQMEYTYTRNKAALATVSFTLERTDTLAAGSWTTQDVSELAPPLSDDGVLQTVKVVLPMGGDRRFVRLKVMELP
ncbi:MAG: MBG domain-containing protein, partial [Luteolibacter sp.]